MAHRATLNLSPWGAIDLAIDGQQIRAVRGIQLTTTGDQVPWLTLDLLMSDVEVEGEMNVAVPDTTHAALVALGWTPPPGEESYAELGTLPGRTWHPLPGHAPTLERETRQVGSEDGWAVFEYTGRARSTCPCGGPGLGEWSDLAALRTQLLGQCLSLT